MIRTIFVVGCIVSEIFEKMCSSRWRLKPNLHLHSGGHPSRIFRNEIACVHFCTMNVPFFSVKIYSVAFAIAIMLRNSSFEDHLRTSCFTKFHHFVRETTSTVCTVGWSLKSPASLAQINS